MTVRGLVQATDSSRGFIVSMSADGAATLVGLRGEADFATLPAFVNVLARVIAEDHGAVVIDLTETAFIDTAIVRTIGRAAELLRERDRQLTLRSPSRLAGRVLLVFGLSHLVERAVTPQT
jgi:anti-anti-sigma factor